MMANYLISIEKTHLGQLGFNLYIYHVFRQIIINILKSLSLSIKIFTTYDNLT